MISLLTLPASQLRDYNLETQTKVAQKYPSLFHVLLDGRLQLSKGLEKDEKEKVSQTKAQRVSDQLGKTRAQQQAKNRCRHRLLIQRHACSINGVSDGHH
jgi:hypothetical protein